MCILYMYKHPEVAKLFKKELIKQFFTSFALWMQTW